MASDYKKIAQENERRYGEETEHLRIYKRLYSDKTHFVSELIQNADDSKSQHLELQLDSNALFVWNDGRQFTEEDVRNICSLGLSDKDLTQIGTFGIGFKAVYNYTDSPEIYSGIERFLIRELIKPESIDIGDITPKIATQLNKGRTVFQLPFKNSLRQEDIERLEMRLRNLDKRSLLFLRHLEAVHWRNADDTQGGSYFCLRFPHDQIQNASYVKLQTSVNGADQLTETFLVFRKEVQPPQYVIDELLHQAEDPKEEQRIQRSAEELQPIEVAFKLYNGGITMINNCVLFAYLPTQIKTDLRFIIQARYQTTPARDNIPDYNPWNKWLVQETAGFLPDVLEQLKADGLLEPSFFNVLPLQDDYVPETFEPVVKALQKVMQGRPFIPTQNGGYAEAKSVFYPHNELLRELFEQTFWLHPEIRNTGKFRRGFEVMREAGVKDIRVEGVLNFLKEQTPDWFASKANEWLRSLYIYLNSQQAEWQKIKNLPLVRLQNGQHVYTANQPVFFPPNETEMNEKSAPFFKELPILQSSLLAESTLNDLETFLKNLGVRTLHPEDLIRESICPKYRQPDKPSIEQNRLHVRYLWHLISRTSKAGLRNLREEISTTPLLLVYKGDQRENLYFLAPCYAYLSQAYTGSTDLETYFFGCDNIWYVDDGYLAGDYDPKDWLRFLKWIGAMDTPKIIRKNLAANSQELNKHGLEWKYSTRESTIEDLYLDSLPEMLDKISNQSGASLSLALWHLLTKALPSGELQRDNFFRGIYRWFYYSSQSEPFDATFYYQLKHTAWLLDEQGNFHFPLDCFAPTDDNRRVLGDSVAYLHPDFDISQDNESARWLAKKLGVHLSANTESVLTYLQTLSGAKVGVEKVEPLYRFLAGQDARPREKFKEEYLIFAPNPQLCWWRTDQVFWEDESPVFDNNRGYLKGYYPETLKPFFTALGVSERAAPLDYVRGIQEMASVGRAENSQVRERVNILYRRLWQSLQEGGDWQTTEEWKQTSEGKYWLGNKGNKWNFFSRYELVWNDHHDYIAEIFKGEVPFWTFDNDLLGLAQNLEIERCSHAEVEFHPKGDQEEYGVWSVKVQELHPYIHDFLNSPRLCEAHEEGKSAHVLDLLSVRLVEELKTTYTLKGISLTHPNPRQSFLDVRDQRATLWIALEADENQYAWLIGDALQDYFGDVKELSGFVEDLLTKNKESVLTRWKQKGLQTDIYIPSPYEDSKEGEKDRTADVDRELLDESNGGNTRAVVDGPDGEIRAGSEDNGSVTSGVDKPKTPLSDEGNDSVANKSEIENGTTQLINGESKDEMPTVTQKPEVYTKDVNSITEKLETPTYAQRTNGTSQSSESQESTSIGKNSVDGHSGRGDTDAKGQSEETEISSHARKEIEHIGMEHARRYEELQGCTVEDVSAENLGFDLRSVTPNGEIRCIEVKARAERALVVLTSNEWETAEQLKDDYFLYVVLNAVTQPELYIIQNPADEINAVEQIDVRYQVPLSEITEHGIRV